MEPVRWQRTFLKIASLLLPVAIHSLPVQTALADLSLPPGQGLPKGSAGGGSRPVNMACLQNPQSQESLIAMAPTRSIGLTAQRSPTVWVYVPPSSAETLEFSLFTQEREGIYQVNLPIPTSGFMKIALSPQAVTLTPGKPYYWTAALVCKPKQRTEDWIVSGWIQQQPIPSTLHRQLLRETVEQQILLYARSGFWYEAFNAYLSLQQNQPQNARLASLWAELQQIAGLKMAPSPVPTLSANP